MGLIALYLPVCPKCGTNVQLVETSLAQIIERRLVSSTGEPFLTFVCPGCKHVFQWDRRRSPQLAQMIEPPRIAEAKYPVLFQIKTRCDDSIHRFPVELLALRDSVAKVADCIAEMPQWKLDDLLCPDGHRILLPSMPDRATISSIRMATTSWRPL